VPPLHHITLSVKNLAVSTAWYIEVLDLAVAAERSGEGWQRVLLRSADGLVLGLTQHLATSGDDGFDEARVGLDHLGFAISDLEQLRVQAERLERMGVSHGGITEADYAYVLTCRDPSGIPIEFFLPR
jgi:glyoxylase I family protein